MNLIRVGVATVFSQVSKSLTKCSLIATSTYTKLSSKSLTKCSLIATSTYTSLSMMLVLWLLSGVALSSGYSQIYCNNGKMNPYLTQFLNTRDIIKKNIKQISILYQIIVDSGKGEKKK